MAEQFGQQDDAETDPGQFIAKIRAPDFFWRPMRNDNHFMVKPNGFLLEYTKNKYWRPTANRFLVQPSKAMNNAKFADFFFRMMYI